MGLHVYCIAGDRRTPPSGLAGLDDQPVDWVDTDGLAAWVSIADTRPEPALDRVRRHHAVVRAAIDDGGVALPVRFGQWLASEAELRTSIADRRSEYERALEHVGGAVEFALRVIDPAAASPARPDPEGEGMTGARYLAALAERSEVERRAGSRGRALREEVAHAVEPFVRDSRVAKPPLPTLVGLAHLVARQHVGDYLAIVRELRRGWPDLRLLLSGPWPPYSFVT